LGITCSGRRRGKMRGGKRKGEGGVHVTCFDVRAAAPIRRGGRVNSTLRKREKQEGGRLYTPNKGPSLGRRKKKTPSCLLRKKATRETAGKRGKNNHHRGETKDITVANLRSHTLEEGRKKHRIGNFTLGGEGSSFRRSSKGKK